MRNLFDERTIPSPDEILREAIEKYNPTHVFGMFSGGRDSVAACVMASRLPGIISG